MAKPLAAIIGDLHFTPQTLELASAALTQAQDVAIELEVPLVLNGDTGDTKVVLRGECVNRLIQILSRKDAPPTYVNVGNHDLFNEKSKEHSLNFLRPYATVVDYPQMITTKNGSFYVIPYQSDNAVMRAALACAPHKTPVVVHQGVQTAFMGHYAQDKSSLPPEAFEGLKVVGSHYHRRQDIQCGKGGLFSYIGNPYTLSFGEAQDGPKGFAILHRDGSLKFVDLPLRRHVVLDFNLRQLGLYVEGRYRPSPGDLVWLKLHGPESELAAIQKRDLGAFLGTQDFRLDLIPDDSSETSDETQVTPTTGEEILDSLIDITSETPEQKSNLKKVWRNLLETA